MSNEQHTGQVQTRLTRFDYDQGPMYFLGQQIVKAMEDSGYPAKISECYRSPERQAELYAKGRTSPGSRVTNARPYESSHQFSLAVDIIHPKLGWDVPKDYWEQLATCVRIVAEKFDVTLNHGHYWKFTDSAHIEVKEWRWYRDQLRHTWREEGGAARPLDDDELASLFAHLLPKVWLQHTRRNEPGDEAEFQTERTFGERLRDAAQAFLGEGDD